MHPTAPSISGRATPLPLLFLLLLGLQQQPTLGWCSFIISSRNPNSAKVSGGVHRFARQPVATSVFAERAGEQIIHTAVYSGEPPAGILKLEEQSVNSHLRTTLNRCSVVRPDGTCVSMPTVLLPVTAFATPSSSMVSSGIVTVVFLRSLG